MSFNNNESIADFENLISLESTIKSTQATRWERKAQQSLLLNNNNNDRFIPNRSGMEKVLEQSTLEENENDISELDKSIHIKVLANNSGFIENYSNTRVLAFKNKAPAPKDGYQSSLKVLYSQQTTKKAEVVKPTRQISSTPLRILDAPDLKDDYYLNLMSWSAGNVLAVALSSTLYLWDAASGDIKELTTLQSGDSEEYISSVAWLPQSTNTLAIGTSDNCIQLWDVESNKMLRNLRGHVSRVSSLSWNNHILSSGSRDTRIINHDVRIQNNVVNTIEQHSQEVCGLAWSPCGSFLASGANDNTLKIFDVSTSFGANCQPLYNLTDHQAAVKALAWSPHERHLLASGGGTADRCIKFWNASSGAMLNSVDTGSQVCALQWSPYERELLSSHGYAENQLCLWKYPTMTRTKELRGHTARVLHLATSPDGSMVCSGAADETLRFWNVFGSEGKRKQDAVSTGASTLSKAKSLKIR